MQGVMLILHVNSLSPSLLFFLLPKQNTLSHIFDTIWQCSPLQPKRSGLLRARLLCSLLAQVGAPVKGAHISVQPELLIRRGQAPAHTCKSLQTARRRCSTARAAAAATAAAGSRRARRECTRSAALTGLSSPPLASAGHASTDAAQSLPAI